MSLHGYWRRNAPNKDFVQDMKEMGLATGLSLNSIYYTCSNCNVWGSPYMKYCHNCGAKMDLFKK